MITYPELSRVVCSLIIHVSKRQAKIIKKLISFLNIHTVSNGSHIHNILAH